MIDPGLLPGLLLALSFAAMAGAAGWIVRKRADLTPKARRFMMLFIVFALSLTMLHLWSILGPQGADASAWSAVLSGIAAVLGLVTATAAWPLLPELLALPSPAALEHANRLMRAEIEGHAVTLMELESERRSLEERVSERTRALRETTERFHAVLRNADILVFSQDRDLRYLWVSEPSDEAGETYLGRSDEEILPEPARSRIVRLKQQVIASDEASRTEVSIAHPGQPTRWYDLTLEPAHDEDGNVIGLAGAAVDITDRKSWESRQRLLMRELNHRSKNLLAVIQAVARQTVAHVSSIDDFLDRFGARLDALARSHDLLVEGSWRGVAFAELVRSQLGHYLQDQGRRFILEGEDITLSPEAAQTLGLALHELATNAAKYGALSSSDGRVTVRWGEDGERFHLAWSEEGGPPVTRPKRRGFGTVVIERNVARTLEADVALTFEPSGMVCRIDAPLANVLPCPEEEND